MIKGNPKDTILVDIDRVLCEAGSEEVYVKGREFLIELADLGSVYIYSSRDLKVAQRFVEKNGLGYLIAGYVEKPNPMAIIDDKAVECHGPHQYEAVLEKVRARKGHPGC